jgi:hypothetical protein
MADKKEISPKHDFPKIGMPATNAFLHLGYTRLKQLTTLTEKEALSIHGVGPKAVGILKEAFKTRGWSFAEEKKK